MALFPYQLEGIALLRSRPGVLLADEMGLGKTVQVIAALEAMVEAGEITSALIVVPAGLLLQWRRELRRWAPGLRVSTVMGAPHDRRLAWHADAQVHVAGYETILVDAGILAATGRRWGVVVLDEAQRIKNPDGLTAQTIKSLRRDRSWALSGTPLENRIDDLISILAFVAPGRFDPAGYMVGLRRLLAEVQLRRRRADVLADLPPKLVSEVQIELPADQRASYERARTEGLVRLRDLGVELRISHVLELILRLKQICNVCPETGSSAKLQDLDSRIEAVVESGERALVFSQFTREPFGVARIARALSRFEPLVLTGGMDVASRASIVRAFESDQRRRLMILSLRAGGLGLNLTSASYVVHFDRWWNPALEAQAEDRTHRIGQTRPVNVYSYVTAGTIEERIAAILVRKRALFADIVDGVSIRRLGRLDLPTLIDAIDGAQARPPGAATDR